MNEQNRSFRGIKSIQEINAESALDGESGRCPQSVLTASGREARIIEIRFFPKGEPDAMAGDEFVHATSSKGSGDGFC